MQVANGYGLANYLSAAALPVAGAPLSMSAWVKFPSGGASGCVCCLTDHDTNNDSYRFDVVSSRVIQATLRRAAVNGFVQTVGKVTADVWSHCGMKVSAGFLPSAIVNGTERVDAGAAGTGDPNNLSHVAVGVHLRTTVNLAFPGAIAQLGIWNVDLSDAEFAELGQGVSPLLVRSGALVAYYPLDPAAPGDHPLGVYDLSLTGSLGAGESGPTNVVLPPVRFRPHYRRIA